MKKCTRCHEEKPLSEYYKLNNRIIPTYEAKCKVCDRKRKMEAKANVVIQHTGQKACIICGEIKDIIFFCINKSAKTGRDRRCLDCFNKSEKIRRAKIKIDNGHPVYKAKSGIPQNLTKFFKKIECDVCLEEFEQTSATNVRCKKCAARVAALRKTRKVKGVNVNVSQNTAIKLAKQELIQNNCAYCNTIFNKLEKHLSASIDHYVPLSRGGTSEFDNLRLCCFGCNISKGALLFEEWVDKFKKILANMSV